MFCFVKVLFWAKYLTVSSDDFRERMTTVLVFLVNSSMMEERLVLANTLKEVPLNRSPPTGDGQESAYTGRGNCGALAKIDPTPIQKVTISEVTIPTAAP